MGVFYVMKSKLSDNQIIEIHRRASLGERKTDLATEFHLGLKTVYRIARGKRHKHLNLTPIPVRHSESVKRQRPMIEKLNERSKLNTETGCIEWTACKTKAGYGQLSVDRKMMFTHRLSYEANIGPIPEGLHVLHSCDNPCCINPDHLRVGTPADNAQDKIDRGRILLGEKHGGAKITENDVIEILRLNEFGVSKKDLARAFGVSASSISLIVKGINWKHIPRPTPQQIEPQIQSCY
jgi:transposase